ncbi:MULTISPECIES: hypothetical protein [unclassified Roseitalea]|uniref:hypothetical protein n=1 Tax=unclassified Roseitalea TaxID=2639107 RepID=UPI00273F13A6|nr:MULTISPECIES: hypothetical protein [unclassified Roseitalea]
MGVAHMASVTLEVPLNFAFDRLTEPAALGRWTLGSFGLAPIGQGDLVEGVSLFDGARSIVEIVPHRGLGLIDYHVGDRRTRVPRVSIRLSPGSDWGLDADSCLAAMSTWRAGWMDEERWARTCATHECEVLLFKAQIETAYKEARQ